MTRSIDCAAVRGFNYQPSYAAHVLAVWLYRFDASAIRRELACQSALNIDPPSASNSDPPLAGQPKLTGAGQSWTPMTPCDGSLLRADSQQRGIHHL